MLLAFGAFFFSTKIIKQLNNNNEDFQFLVNYESFDLGITRLLCVYYWTTVCLLLALWCRCPVRDPGKMKIRDFTIVFNSSFHNCLFLTIREGKDLDLFYSIESSSQGSPKYQF